MYEASPPLPEFRSRADPYLGAASAYAGMRSPTSPGFCWAGGGRAHSSATRRCGKIRPSTASRRPRVDDIGDFVVWATLGVIVGGRLGWVLFYGTFSAACRPECAPIATACRWSSSTDPLRIIAAWEGGMSFHGGADRRDRGAVAFRPQPQNRFRSASAISWRVCAPIGLFFGRIANFINGELWGKVDGCSLGDGVCSTHLRHGGRCPQVWPRHPSQLYEAGMEGLLLFFIMLVSLRVFRLHERPGLLGAIFLTGYGTFRFIAEIFREPDTTFIGWFSLGMAFSIPMWLGRPISIGTRFRPRGRAVVNALGATHRAADRGARPAVHRAIHDDGAARSAGRLLRDARSVRCARRFHHRARDQPDLRRAYRAVVRAGLDRSGRAARMRGWSNLDPARGALMADALRAAKLAPEFLRGHRSRDGRSESGSVARTAGAARKMRRHGASWQAQFDESRRPSAVPDRQRILRRAAHPPIRADGARLVRDAW